MVLIWCKLWSLGAMLVVLILVAPSCCLNSMMVLARPPVQPHYGGVSVGTSLVDVGIFFASSRRIHVYVDDVNEFIPLWSEQEYNGQLEEGDLSSFILRHVGPNLVEPIQTLESPARTPSSTIRDFLSKHSRGLPVSRGRHRPRW